MRREFLRPLRTRSDSHVAHPAVVVAAVALELLLWGGDGRLRGLSWPAQPWVVVAVEGTEAVILLTGGRSLKRAYLSVWLLSVAMALLFPGIEPFVGVLIVLYRLGRTGTRRSALPYAAATAVPWVVNVANAVDAGGVGVGGAAVDALLWGILTVLVWMAARYGWGLEQLAIEREAAAVQRSELALQNERMRLARELHDVVSHSVSAMILQAAGAKHAMASETPMRDVLDVIETTGTSALRELRGLLGLLRPHPDRPPEAPHQLVDIADVVTTTRACGIHVDVTESGRPGALDLDRQVVGYRVVQEGLTNVIRHRGTGGQAVVRLTWSDPTLVIEILSTGGAPSATPVGGPSGRGLEGLQARLAEVGGELTSRRNGPDEFLLRATIPTNHR